jgi:outer membrane biosynthesis protein TonB
MNKGEARPIQKRRAVDRGRRISNTTISLILSFVVTAAAQSERINQEGRILGPAPIVNMPTLFNTPQADAIISAMQIFPVTNPWNEDISRRPLLANSATMISQLKSDLSSSRQTLRPFYEMNYVLVPDNQARVTIAFVDYPDESDLDGGTFPNGSYPIPSNMPIETWPRGTGSLTLQQWQMDATNVGGDRHGIMVAPGVGSFWETWQMKLTTNGWQASNGAKFDLNSNALRPAGWTSGDAAGLPMFPALVRYDECERGAVEHAVRLCVPKTRKEYIYPANHSASSIPATSTQYPAMGQRFRLKASFVVPSTWTIEEKAVCYALKKYGAIVADNSGGFFSISVCPDNRFASNAFDNLSTIDVSNFEVIQSTGPAEGPRSSGAPTVNAGADQSVNGLSATLTGAVVDPSGAAAILWKLYSGPMAVNIVSPNTATTNVNFTQAGTYTFELSASDGIHAVAYDAVIVNVQSGSPSPTPTATPTSTPTPTATITPTPSPSATPSPTPTPTTTPSPTPSPTPTPTATISPTPAPTPTPTSTPSSTPTITVSVSPSSVVEGSSAIFIFSSSGAVSQPLTVTYSMRGTAINGSDYTLDGTPGQVTIAAGQTSTTVTLQSIADHVKEKNETAIMVPNSGSGYKLPKRGTKATVTIVNGL